MLLPQQELTNVMPSLPASAHRRHPSNGRCWVCQKQNKKGDDCADFPCANSLQIHRAEVKIATWLPCCANPGQGLFATEDLPQGAYVADSGPFRVLSHVKHTAK